MIIIDVDADDGGDDDTNIQVFFVQVISFYRGLLTFCRIG